MRAFTMALAGAIASALAGPSLSQVVIDAAALDGLERRDPTHDRKVQEVLGAAAKKDCVSAARVLATQLDVKNAHCEPALLRTSYPPKQRLTFTLDGTPYVVFVAAPARMDLLR